MAERRMFAKSIIDSDAFLDMPTSAQALYFHFGMRADDDGFVNSPNKIMKMVNASTDDLKLLIAKSFLIPFESGVVVIKHWKIHNYIKSDRYKPTNYTEEKEMLSYKDNGAYTLENTGMYPECIQDVSTTDTQVRLGKGRSGKDRLGKVTKSEPKTETVYYPLDETLDKTFKDYMAMRKEIKKPMTDRAIELAMSKLEELSGSDNDIAIAILEQSIMNSWQGLFELKEKTEKTTSNIDKWQAAADELERRRNELN